MPSLCERLWVRCPFPSPYPLPQLLPWKGSMVAHVGSLGKTTTHGYRGESLSEDRDRKLWLGWEGGGRPCTPNAPSSSPSTDLGPGRSLRDPSVTRHGSQSGTPFE